MRKFNTKKLDTIIGIVGIIVSIVASFDIIGLFEKIFKYDIISYLNFLLGLSVLIVIFIKKKSFKTDFIRISSEQIPKFLTSYQIKSRYNRVAIFNPDAIPSISMLIEYFNTNDFGMSIIGDANNLLNIFNSVNSQNLSSLSKFFHVLSFSQNASIILLYNDGNSPEISIVYKNDSNVFVTNIKDEKISSDINSILFNKDELLTKSIKLDHISKPEDFLRIIDQEKEKYVNNFKNLKSGHISFYGTEVLRVQSGWLESGNFKSIRTLDLTSDPGILLTRHNYIEANRKFIEHGGSIKRIYLINKSQLNDSVFYNNLIVAIRLQKKLGVQLGLRYLEELDPRQKQDFILYDDFASFVEEKQANSDYSFGKSTAYFSKDKIKEYEAIFSDVWNGQALQLDANECLDKFINESTEKEYEN